MKGRTIKLFLVTGSTSGLRSAEVLNWTGKVFACPRSQLKDLIARDEIAATGIYFLIGHDPNPPGDLKVYIGESDDVATRLKQHNNDKRWDFWEDTIVVVSKDENLTKSHVAYLEHRFQTRANDIGAAKLATYPEPAKKLPESDLADMLYFEEQVLMLMPALGCDWLAPAHKTAGSDTLFELQVPTTDRKASAVESDDGEFIVKAGSHARSQHVPSLGQNYQTLRQTLVAEGKLTPAEGGQSLIFRSDVPFNSPSAAASVVTGAQTNGRDAWRIGSKSYGQWDKERLEAAAGAPEPPGTDAPVDD